MNFSSNLSYTFYDTIEAKISSIGGGSDGPLIRYYKYPKTNASYKYIIGTTMGSANGQASFAKTEKSKKNLNIVSY